MITHDIAKILADSWPSYVGAIIGSTIGHISIGRSPDVERLKRNLGPALDRFADIPRERLDPALLAVEQSVQRSWGSVGSILATALWLVAGLLSAELYRASFPELPRWHGIVVCGAVAAQLAWSMQKIKRRVILRKLEHLHSAN